MAHSTPPPACPSWAAVLVAAAGRRDELVTLLEQHGNDLLAAGLAADVVRLLRDGPGGPRTHSLRLVYADALRMTGDVTGAEREFAPLLQRARESAAAGRGGDPAVLWRAAMVPYMRADYPAALDICDVAGPVPAGDPVDTAFLLAVRSSTLAMLDRAEEAAVTARAAMTRAAAADGASTAADGASTAADGASTAADGASTAADGATAAAPARAGRRAADRARAAACIAASLSAIGSRRAEYLGAAVAAATAAGDVVQTTRALVNQAESLIREARYREAHTVAARAVAVGEQGCPPGMLAAALANAGDALLHLGHYDEAAEHFERVVRLSHRAGLRRAAVGHWGLAEVHGRLGRWERSRTAFEEAAQLARADGDWQVLVPSLAGLVRVLLDGPAPDVTAARTAAEEAERVATGLLLPFALAARGWVAYAEGDLACARDRGNAAVTGARHGRRADCLAMALELLGTVSAETPRALAALREAEAIWRAAGADPAADRVQVLIGRRPNADAGQRLAARLAARRLMDLGVRAVDGADLRLTDSTSPVRIRVLGGFDVFVEGRPVALSAWRSRQARSLVKILVARRGQPIPRPELRELLWPDEDPHRTAHRLSVLLSAVRTVLDPGRRWPADHHISADVSGIWLATDHVAVDVLELIRDAAHADRLHRAGATAEALEMLTHVDQLYQGDTFCDEPYEDWADPLREEARAVWLRTIRDLARFSRRAGDLDRAVTLLVRLLAADPYDESAHRELVESLVRAGRRGEARRAFDRWHRAMRSLDAPVPSRLVLNRLGPSDHNGVSLQ